MGLSKNIIFKSFTGLRIKEFDGIHNKELAKRCEKHRSNDYPTDMMGKGN